MRKKIVFWKHEITGVDGHGMPLEAYLADAWTKKGNEDYPDIIHMAVDADITKMLGVHREEMGE